MDRRSLRYVWRRGFFPYAVWPKSLPGWVAGVATVAGGPVIGVAVATHKITDFNSANITANCCRAWMTGASIEERIRRHKGKAEPIVVPTDKLGNLAITEGGHSTGNLISIHTDTQHLLIKVDNPFVLKQAVYDLTCGSPNQGPDTEFANLRLPPLGWLFQQFASGDVIQLRESGVLDDIAQNREYMERFTTCLSECVTSTRVAVIDGIARTPGPFAEMFAEAQSMRAWLRRAVRSSGKGCLVGIIVALVLIAVFYFLAISQSNPKYLRNFESNSLFLFSLIGALGFLGAISGLFSHPLPPRYSMLARVACVVIPACACAIPLMVMAIWDSGLACMAICAAFFAGLFPASRQFGGGDEIQINNETTKVADPPASCGH